MNQIISSFPQILKMAEGYGLPAQKKRAILREYLQVKILAGMYRQKASAKCHFIGGTALRLLHGLDRFSEDLDFNYAGSSEGQIKDLIETTRKELTREGINVFLYENKNEGNKYYELRFENLLSQLNISPNKDEKLTIKFDFEPAWKGEVSETVLLNRYGILVNVVSVPVNQMVVQKMAAYLNRSQTQPRDIYDIVWLIAQGAKVDWQFAEKNGFGNDFVNRVEGKFTKEAKQVTAYKRRLKPFLIDESKVENIDYLAKVIRQLM